MVFGNAVMLRSSLVFDADGAKLIVGSASTFRRTIRAPSGFSGVQALPKTLHSKA